MYLRITEDDIKERISELKTEIQKNSEIIKNYYTEELGQDYTIEITFTENYIDYNIEYSSWEEVNLPEYEVNFYLNQLDEKQLKRLYKGVTPPEKIFLGQICLAADSDLTEQFNLFENKLNVIKIHSYDGTTFPATIDGKEVQLVWESSNNLWRKIA
jgi:hypothetical protein